METKFQASFIPKQAITASSGPERSTSSNFIFLICFIIFMVSVALGAAAFLYNQLVEKNIADGQKQLQLNQNAFDSTTIQQLTRLNDRLAAAETLLKQHIAFSNFFDALQKVTLKNVQFTDFAYTYGGGSKIGITMHGSATSYETVALQSKAFTDPSLQSIFHSPIFGDPSLDANGNVTFSFSVLIDPSMVSYYQQRSTAAQAQNILNQGGDPTSGIVTGVQDPNASSTDQGNPSPFGSAAQ